MKTIPRSATRKIAAIRKAVTRGLVYDIRTNFEGTPVTDWNYVWTLLERGGKLTENSNGTYNINLHGNFWVKLFVEPETAPVVAESDATGE